MSKFSIHVDLQERGIPTLFKYHRFTIDAGIHKEWKKMEDYLKVYKLEISSAVFNTISKEAAEILKDMTSNTSISFSVESNKGERYMEAGKTPYIRCVFDKAFLEYIKRLFISTIVYEAKKKTLPIEKHETIDFEFDTHKEIVTITNIKLYEPQDDPFFTYARNAVYTLSVEAIGIGDYSVSDEDHVKDFYSWNSISGWKKRDVIMKEDGEETLEGKAGIYMLYNAEKNEFYVGKARNLKERIIQHAKNVTGNDPIWDFTHYRYSLINMEYFEFLYLIENAAIHDCAMLIDMPKAAKLNKPLVNVADKASRSLNDCRMVNTHERQRKVEKQ
ncbi:MAG: GIY-YIG nuclease family protein [Lachnospiraceae bacterium]|nr:GIY-YIG nuclease family protein [Lachnospiraceae bacterium]